MWEQLANVVSGLKFIHKDLGCQHLDLSPSNILIFEVSNTQENELDAEGELIPGLGGELPINPSSPSSILFRICDLGEENIGPRDPSNACSKLPAATRLLTLGDPSWSPPERNTLRMATHNVTNQQLQAYDYWSLGGILLEGAVFDIGDRMILATSEKIGRETTTNNYKVEDFIVSIKENRL
ncbi:hypothetical protein AA313_de0204270 [Arthrobotrys entomopaga]|nr:hypothetical protein AA313_de0204270 [Arthrobotrys entomopaga]